MSCSSCSTSKDGVPKGCKSNGNCASGSCGSGNKLAVFDWLSNMTLPTGEAPFSIYEVRFKNGRKHFFKNTEKLTLSMGDVVAVEGSSGHDVGVVSLAGELVKVQMRKRKVAFDSEDVKRIYRKASQKDIDVWQNARDRELETQRRGREIISKLGLKMKLSDVEFQGDGTKATFYYTADERVDFRQLIRDLASAFSIRVEMRQVGMRQEAARLGGVGSCGRELCCSTWLTDFRKVNTAAARYQQLSLNPLKLAGQCGKLKCCLNFELDTYLDALKEFPAQDLVLKTEKGDAVFVKMDIFKELLWYTYKEESFKWYKLSLEQVQEIIELNENKELASPLEEYESEILEDESVDFENVVGQDSLTRFDTPKKPKRNRRRNRKRPQNKKGGTAQNNSKNAGGSKPKSNAGNSKGEAKKPAEGTSRNSRSKSRNNRAKNTDAKKGGQSRPKPNQQTKTNPQAKSGQQTKSNQQTRPKATAGKGKSTDTHPKANEAKPKNSGNRSRNRKPKKGGEGTAKPQSGGNNGPSAAKKPEAKGNSTAPRRRTNNNRKNNNNDKNAPTNKKK